MGNAHPDFFQGGQSDDDIAAGVHGNVLRRDAVPEMDMGWVHPWVGLGWVGSHFSAHVMGWVE